MIELDLALHTYSLLHTFRHRPGFDVFACIDLAAGRGFSGLNLSLNGPDWRHLGGKSPEHLARVRRHIEEFGLSLEIDTSGTEPGHLKTMLTAAHALGARNLRTYTRHVGTPAEMIRNTIADLKQAAVAAEALGVEIVIENHEEFTGPELMEVVAAVDSPWVGVVYDYGNSQPVLEDPLACLEVLLPRVRTLHLKDHLMLRPEHAPEGRLCVLGVPVGDGALPIMEITRRLVDSGQRRIVLLNVWSYRAPVVRSEAAPGVVLGAGAFGFAKRPFARPWIEPDRERIEAQDPLRVSELEIAALDRSHAWLRAAFAEAGYACRRAWHQAIPTEERA